MKEIMMWNEQENTQLSRNMNYSECSKEINCRCAKEIHSYSQSLDRAWKAIWQRGAEYILKFLDRSWQPKVTTISEARHLTTLTTAALFGKLREHELEMTRLKEMKTAEKKTWSLALKSKVAEVETNEDNSEEESDTENLNLLSKKFQKVIRMKGRTKNQNNKRYNRKSDSNSNKLTCFACGKQGYMKTDYPNLVNREKTIKKKNYKAGKGRKGSQWVLQTSMPFWVLKTVFLKKLALVIKLVFKENRSTIVFLKQMRSRFHFPRPVFIVWEKVILWRTVKLWNLMCLRGWLGGCLKASLTILDPSLTGYQCLKFNLFYRSVWHLVNYCSTWTVDAPNTWLVMLPS